MLDYLDLKSYHVLGHGTAALATLELARHFGVSLLNNTAGSKTGAVLSVTLASPILDASILPSDFLESIRTPLAAAGGNEVIALMRSIDERTEWIALQ